MFEWLARLEEAQENLREVLESQAEGLTLAEASRIARRVERIHQSMQRLVLSLDSMPEREW